jgi:hypothetical protein
VRVSLEKPGTPTEIVHFGIKGQKWGVRKEKTSSPELKKQAQTAFRAKTEPVATARIKQMLSIDPLSMNDYKQMSTKATEIPSGKTLYRLTRTPNDISLSGHTYVSTNKKDAEIYRGLLPAQRLFDPIRKSDYKPQYEISLKTTKTLRGPSEKERIDILSKLVDDKTAVNGKMSIREYYKKSNVISRKEAKTATGLELALITHRRIHQNMFVRKDPISRSYMDAVRKKGYDMLSDDNDSGIVAKSPMIILNPQKSTQPQKITALSNDDILKAQINLRFPKSK